MIILLLWGIAIIAVFFWAKENEGSWACVDTESRVWGVVLAGFIALMVRLAIVILIAMLYTGSIANSNIVTIEQHNLTPIGDTYLSGYTDKNDHKKFDYAMDTEAGITTASIYQQYSFIKPIDNDETPYVVMWKFHHKNKFLDWIGCHSWATRATFYLPEDTATPFLTEDYTEVHK